MKITSVKKIIVRNSIGQEEIMEYTEFLEYLYNTIQSGDADGGKRFKIALIKLVRANMASGSLRGAKIFVEDALGQIVNLF
jgi:hypothetical protein